MENEVLKTLDDYIAYQAAFQERVIPMRFPGKEFPEELTASERNEMLIKMVLGVIEEIMEFLKEATNHKVHKGDHSIDLDKVTEEYVDAMKYMLNLPVYIPEIQTRFKGMFLKKSLIVQERLTQEQQRIRESQDGGGEHV